MIVHFCLIIFGSKLHLCLHPPKALNIVFGSLYLDEVMLDPKTVVSVLAAATIFQLDGLLEKCCEVMNATINAEVSRDIC